jgi:predicted transcriptional regulator
MNFKIEFKLVSDNGITVTQVFQDSNLNNPVNEAQKLLEALKTQGFRAMYKDAL